MSFVEQSQETQPQEDYQKLLILVIILLGGIPLSGIHFRAPAGLHRARWMARLLYRLKIFIFGRILADGGQFKLTAKEEHGLREFI